MPMTMSCACGNSLHVHDHLAGKLVACPSCGALVHVPNARDQQDGRDVGTTTRNRVQEGSNDLPRLMLDLESRGRQTLLRSLALTLAIVGALIAASVGMLMTTAMNDPQGTQLERRTAVGFGYLFFAVGVLGVIGGALAFSRRRWWAVALLMVAALAPVGAMPALIVFTFPFMIAAALAVAIRPRRRGGRRLP